MEPQSVPAGSAETAALVALLRIGADAPANLADLVEEAGSARAVLEEQRGLFAAQLMAAAAAEIERWEEQGIQLVTLLDGDYPQNLRAVYDRPPLLFVVGRVEARDIRSIAVIGSRRASPEGVARAQAITEHLVDLGYTIVSGLAAGIDAAAHLTALEREGRTIAVVGTGVQRVYPPQNASLQQRIGERGAVISQFVPDSGPSRQSFPRRNALMSGLALGTIIVEASHTSGARVQARAALAHGRPVLLSRTLLDQSWARELAARPGVYVIRSLSELDDVLAKVTSFDTLVA